MANTIEVRIRAASDTSAVYDAEKARAAAAGRDASAAYTSAFASGVRGNGGKDISQSLTSALSGGAGTGGSSVGQEIGDQISDSISDTIGKELPAKVKDPIKKSGTDGASAFTSAFTGGLDQSLSGSALSGMAQSQGEKFSISFGQGAKAGMQESTVAAILQPIEDEVPAAFGPDSAAGQKIRSNAKQTGQQAGQEFSSAYARAAGGGDPLGLSKSSMKQRDTGSSFEDVLDPSGPAATKIKQDAKETGQQAGQAMGGGMSPLIVTAIGGAAAVAAPALLAGMGAAFVGISALALKSNKVIAADYESLGKTASAALSSAVTPVAGTMNEALLSMQGTVKELTPQLQGLFAEAQPDITSVANGVDSFAKGILPGLSSALGGSQVIVSDFSSSLGPLGQGVGSFFQNLTRDANTTGAGLQSLVGTVGDLASTLGTVLGSAASVGSTALMGLDPVINTLLTGIQKIANPGTVGAVAGLFGAMKLGGDSGALTSGLQSAAKGLGNFAKDAEKSTGVMGTLKGAAGGLGSAFGKAADIVSGPWGMAIGAGIGLATGLAGALINSAKASDALTLSQQGLNQAVQQDNGSAGSATAAFVAQQAAANGLANSAQSVGVSMSTWTQAVLGNKQAQEQVTSAVEKANQATRDAQVAQDGTAHSSGKFAGELDSATQAVDRSAAANNTLTDSNAQIINSMQAQTKQIADAIAADTKYEQALNEIDNATAIFNATLDAGYKSLVANAQQSALNTVAALGLGDANTLVNDSMYKSLTAYSLAQSGANAYLQVLDSMSGAMNNLLGTEAAFTTSLSQMDTAVKANGTSLDVNKAKGAANITTFTQIANAADKAAAAVWENEVNTKGNAQATDDANAKLVQEKTAFENAAIKAGFAKDSVVQLANELFKLPDNMSVDVSANTKPARSGVNTLISSINSESATIRINAMTGTWTGQGGHAVQYAHGGNISAAASGGARGARVLVGEAGPELVNLPYGSSVTPNANLQSMGGGGGTVRVQLEWVGGGNDDPMFQMLRKGIRVRGGNVQKVLGVNR